VAKVHRYHLSAARSNEIVCRNVATAQAKGVLLRSARRYDGRRLELDGRPLRNFGSCSYLGLEQRAELRAAAMAAIDRYGTQFPFSRAYLQCALYEELEANLESMTGRPVLVAPSTTLAHMAALPVLLHDNDAALIDQFAHASLHTATELLHDVPVRLVRHNRLDQVERWLAELGPRHERIWLIIDGVYSMFGDVAPFDGLADLLQRHAQLHLYIDDAHATSWTGTCGRGVALTRFGGHERVVVALSLNKAFSAAGGALALPDEQCKMTIRRCGGPMLFSGPIQPPMLGAAVASSRLHLSADHATLQHELADRIDYAQRAADAAGLPLATHCSTPIFFIDFDSFDEATDAVRDLMARGFYVCPAAFPAVPVNRPGVRFTVSLHNEREDIDAFIAAASEVIGQRCSRPAAVEATSPERARNPSKAEACVLPTAV
jgi:7-keto-8-aminopelargonate synthetase-like enzyme